MAVGCCVVVEIKGVREYCRVCWVYDKDNIKIEHTEEDGSPSILKCVWDYGQNDYVLC